MAKQDEIEEVVSGEIEASAPRDVASMISGFNDPSAAVYNSIKGTDFESRKLIAKAQSSAQPLNENFGKEIELTNFIIQAVQIENEQTGEVNDAPRTTLIAADGTAYHTSAMGIVTALRNIVGALGEPETWPQPVTVVASEQRGKRGFRFMTLELV